MSKLLYIRLTMTIPQVGTSTHIAQLQEHIAGQPCSLLKIIELDPHGRVQGAANESTTRNLAAPPERTVPHPEKYKNFPDIKSSYLTEKDFFALWQEVLEKFPELG
ncbi:hypothetical protein [Corynebacterium sp. sy039]|uniref:hypothetical protein n=1 Tax=Corynebacterium sp. sy039 TaxID=2599641 RepID=UPI0011B654F9|nr:hypothetical protein [Corynebacterium sp. sy039]QDZ43431.1 hypothetical protein FQV43_09980 [Corynebacterium sp. sy039]